MRTRSTWACVAFVAAFVLNPAYFAGCIGGEDEPEFTYDAQDMAEFVREAKGSFEFSDGGAQYRLELDVAPSAKQSKPSARVDAFARSAYACGNRRLVATASACEDYSTMGVAGTFKLLRTETGSDQIALSTTTVQGEATVDGLNLSFGEMYLDFDGGVIELQSDDGKSFELSYFMSDAVTWPKRP